MGAFSDRRLQRRCEQLQQAMIRKNSVILRRLADNRKEEVGFGRFLSHKEVTYAQILSGAIGRTNQASEGRHVLLVQDTTTLAFGLFPKAGILGPIAGGKGVQGLYLHPAICLDAVQGACLGLGAAKRYEREHYSADDPRQDKAYRKRERSQKVFTEKESARWGVVAQQAVEQLSLASRHTVIADSEADIYEVMVLFSQQGTDFVLRSYENRTVHYPRSGENINEWLAQQPVRSTYQAKLPATDKRSAHTATLEIKWERVALARPKNTANKELPLQLEATVVEVCEQPASVVGNEQPIHWRLFTSHRVENEQQALQIVRWYSWRWAIEQVFRALKTKGLDIEAAQVESPHKLWNLIALCLISAVRVMQLVQARDGQSDLTAQHLFDPQEVLLIQRISPSLEGGTQKQKNPYSTTSLAFAVWGIARLGGWSGYASQRPPGPITMLHGLRRLQDLLFVYRLHSSGTS